MVDISLSSWGVRRCGALALPVEQVFIDRIIVIHGGGRIVFICLIQCHKEHIQLLFRQPLDSLAHRRRFQKIHRHQQLVPGVGAVEIQRTIEAKFYWLVNKIDLLVSVAKQIQKLAQQYGTARESMQVAQRLIGCPTLCYLAPDGHIEHLEHPLLQLTQRCEVHIVQTGQHIQQKSDPSPGVHNGQPTKGFCEHLLQRFVKICNHIRPGADP